MNALDTLIKIAEIDTLYDANLRYCLVGVDKRPYKIDGTSARPNTISDFVDFDKLMSCNNLQDYAGIGISIQGSNICAIDIDHCFTESNNVDTADERAKTAIEMFKDKAYIEFSFSGTGLRILFRHNLIDDYSEKYYIKNDKTNIEFYQPSNSYRYVTITGNVLYDNNIDTSDDLDETLFAFLNKYMVRRIKIKHDKTEITDDASIDELMKKVKHLYRINIRFQSLWFGKAPGSGSNESQLDYHLLAELYENITHDKEKLRLIFEQSPYFKSKDSKHLYKWNYNDFRYFEYMYNEL